MTNILLFIFKAKQQNIISSTSNPMLTWILDYTVTVTGIIGWILTKIKQQYQARTII